MTRVWLVILCACNQVYNLDPTTLQDARGIDAPARCTNEPLVFNPQAQQIVLRSCRDYTFAGETAVALCELQFGVWKVAEGAIDGPLVDVEITSSRTGTTIVAPRLTPDGELLVAQRATGGTASLSLYTRNNGWTWSRDLPFTLASSDHAGVPSRGPRRHLMISRTGTFEEVVEGDNNTWTSTPLSSSVLGVTDVLTPINLSADGLRAVFGAPEEVRYAVREDIDMPFSGSHVLDVPLVLDAVLAEDCSRLYFSGLESIFYVQR